MIMPFVELVIVVLVLWVVLNVLRAAFEKASQGGGFWSIYRMIVKEETKDKPKSRP